MLIKRLRTEIKPYWIRKNRCYVIDLVRTYIRLKVHPEIISSISSIQIIVSGTVYSWNGVSMYQMTNTFDYIDGVSKLYQLWKDSGKTRRVTLIYHKTHKSLVHDIITGCKVGKFVTICPYKFRDDELSFFDKIRDGAQLCDGLTHDAKVYLCPTGDIYVCDRALYDVRYTSKCGHNLVVQSTTPKHKVVTVEDYCKWYDLYIIDQTRAGGPIFEGWDYDTHFSNDVQWFDHAPEPKSVVQACKKHGLRLDWMSYLAICCRWAEDVEECDLVELADTASIHLPSKDELDEVLLGGNHYIRSYCEYFRLPMLTIIEALKLDDTMR